MVETVVANTLLLSLHQERLIVTSFREIWFSKIQGSWAKGRRLLNNIEIKLLE